jgi:alanyl-tRNA synthetase
VAHDRRAEIQRHHTVTHLLHWAIHQIVSADAAQKGSYVGPDKLTFDFNSQALKPAQVEEIEKLVNHRIIENALISAVEAPFAEVKQRKDIMQIFGEKYGETVRVVQIGGRPRALDGYSMELCGGTHTRATGEIGLFRVVGEGAIAAGIRRIEAVAGARALARTKADAELIAALSRKVNSPVVELEQKIENLLTQQKQLEKALRAAKQREAAQVAKSLVDRAKTVNGVPALFEDLGKVDGDFLQAVADALKGDFQGVVVLGGRTDGAVALVATVAPDLTKRVQAGRLLQSIAPIVGGRGGGRPDNARGGGKETAKLGAALAKARELLGQA